MPTHHLPLRPPALLRLAAAWGLAGALAWALPAWAQPTCPEAAQVGRLGTVIGQGHIHAGEHSRPAERGAGVCVGERIETSAGGHVHIRFVDGALVSVRPSSRLHIEAYPQAAAGPVRFRLEAGVVRAVSGDFARTEREQFRLNTPLAAIGIRGTDFVVRADTHATRATVLSGAIVVAPVLGDCSLGPQHCPEQALILSADMSHLMIELSRDHPLPRLLPALDLLAAGRVGSSSTTATVVQNTVAPAPAPASADAAALTPGTTQPEQRTGLETKAQLALGQLPPFPPSPSSPPQLHWLHWVGLGGELPPHSLSQRFDAALAAGLSPTVGNFAYTLYRDERTLSRFAPEASSASFILRQGQAHFHPSQSWVHRPEVLQVERGQLQVDFANARFATQLELRGPSVSSQFAAAGAIDAQGYFRATGAGHSLAGAFATDGSQAGYFFNQAVPSGHISGLTLWGR